MQWLFRAGAILGALLASVQPLLGSFAFFRRADPVAYETIHLVVGGILYNIPIVLALVVFFTSLRRRWFLFVLCLAQYGLTHLQLWLGLASNQNARVLAYHIPLGVLIFFVAYLMVALAFDMRFGSRGRESQTHKLQTEDNE
jgi:heme A synthase